MKTIKIVLQVCRPISVFRKHYFALCIILLIATSCGKDEDARPIYEDGKSTVIYDLPGDTDASMATGVNGKEKRDFYMFLFRFRDQRQIWIKTKTDSTEWLKTDEWDLAFTGPYNSEIYVNNANYAYNPGFEGEATRTAVVHINQPYDLVTEAPSDEQFDQSEVTKIGWASSESSPGWFRYSLNTHIMQAIPNRTYIIRLPDGRHAKLQLINAYKGNPETVTNLKWPAPYFTFRYFVQQDGSKNLTTN
ncbi:HmuY family protein [Sphingobacterium suaedae]|uniref:HmuY family protein n=1 Tax=Sphingobacterium suaedae TaxID=1686402 RepID=A0ABW5KG03_9SPHI